MLMYFHVFPTIDVSLEGFVTVRAHKWSLITVRDQVSFHAALRGKLRIAHRTAVRPQIVVRVQV